MPTAGDGLNDNQGIVAAACDAESTTLKVPVPAKESGGWVENDFEVHENMGSSGNYLSPDR